MSRTNQSPPDNCVSPELIGGMITTLKYADYEKIGILEYWIVDYAALGGRNFIGNPKQPTISVCNLVDGEYRITKFQNDEQIVSQTFLDLKLTANQIFQAGAI